MRLFLFAAVAVIGATGPATLAIAAPASDHRLVELGLRAKVR
jgi:hypothetical protein